MLTGAGVEGVAELGLVEAGLLAGEPPAGTVPVVEPTGLLTAPGTAPGAYLCTK